MPALNEFQRLARQFLALLQDRGITPPQNATVEMNGQYLDMIFRKGEPPVRDRTTGLTRCQQDILEVFEEVGEGQHQTAADVFQTMKQAGFPYSLALVRKSLTQLSRAGELRNARNKRGYWLPRQDQPSLFD